MGMRNISRSDGIPKEVGVRSGCSGDANYIKDIDLKSYQYPFQYNDWKNIGSDKSYHWCVAIIEAQPIGFAIWHDEPAGIELIRLGVKLTHRCLGAGTRLLNYVVDYAKEMHSQQIYTIVPEIECFPGHPDDVSQWLSKRDFRAEPPIARDYFYMYGEWVDGFKFVRHLELQK